MKKTFLNLILLLCFTFVVGCAAERNFLRAINDSNDSLSYGNQIKECRDRLALYIGQESQKVLNAFGEPTEIKKNVTRSGKFFEEEWYYHRSKGLLFINQNSWAYIFYINKGIVEDVVFL